MCVAAAIAGSAVAGVAGSVISSNAAKSAANTQAQAADQASAQSQQQFDTIQSEQMPFIQAGQNAIGQLEAGTAPGGQFTQTFNNSDLNSLLAPNFEFTLNQGLGTAANQANASGGLIGGNALQGVNSFAQNFAENSFQNAFNNFNTNQTNIFNRLSDIAGLGQTATSNTANAGIASTNASNNLLTSAAASQAAGQVGSANAISSGLNNATSSILLGQLLRQPTNSAPLATSIANLTSDPIQTLNSIEGFTSTGD